jgi:trk system potassium uptake protein TrkH
MGWILMTIGGGMGSTSGGIKQYRIGILGKEFYWFLRYHDASDRTISPHVVRRLGVVKELGDDAIKEARNYTLLCLVVTSLGAMTLMFLPRLPDISQGDWFQRCFYEFMNGFTSNGMSMMDYVGYKAAHPVAYKGFIWVETLAMFFGRLEILPVIFALWRFIIDPIREMRYNSKKARPSME